MPEPKPWTRAELAALATRAVAKVDRLGERGVTTCTMDEIAALAAVVAITGAIERLNSEGTE